MKNKKQYILQIPWIKKIILFCIVIGVGYLIYRGFNKDSIGEDSSLLNLKLSPIERNFINQSSLDYGFRGKNYLDNLNKELQEQGWK